MAAFEAAAPIDIALYLHIPFCLQRCTYCDFNTYTGLLDLREAYTEALIQELALWTARTPVLHAQTLYFGGGTPSLLPTENVPRVIDAARRHFALAAEAEITLEANPGTLDAAQLQALRQAGVNRLSLGAQSARADELALLGRIHTWQTTIAAVDLARQAGFDNLSLDLIFGLPQQTLAAWAETLESVLALSPEHLSLYALRLEPGTPLAEQVSAGILPVPDPDLAADMYELATETLHAAGFWQYEISNWAKSTLEIPAYWAVPPAGRSEAIGKSVSRHNLAYWRNHPWLGIGAGAHSWLGGQRWSNLPHPSGYITAITRQQLQRIDELTLSRALHMGETLMLGLRLAEGVTEAAFRARFQVGLDATYGDVIARFSALGLVEWDGVRLRLSTAGRLLGNPIFAAFLP